MSPSGFLPTRVARRLLLLFLLAAVVPVGLFAWLAERHVASQLEAVERERLRDQNKATGLRLLSHLETPSSELARNAVAVGDLRHPATWAPVRSSGEPHFSALVLEGPKGQVSTLRGAPFAVPQLDEGQQAHLGGGNTLLIVEPCSIGSNLVLGRSLGDQRGRLWGLVNPDSAWNDRADGSPAPPDTHLCLLGPGQSPLTCDMSTVLPAARLGSGAGLFEWESGGAHWFTSSWSLVLGHEFGAAPWTVLLSVDRATVRAPLAVFRRTFLLGVLLAVQVAFVLSHVYLRRSLTPLERLHAGTRRLAAGDFSTPVQVESGDEFGTLAESFNRMAADLRRDFVVLEALHQVDRAALSAQTPEPILLTLFSQAALLFPGERCAVAWTSGDREDSTCTLHVRAEQVEEPCRQQMRLRLAGLAHLAQGAEGRRGLATELLPRPAAEALAPGSGEVAVVPLFRGGRVAGFLAVTDPSGRKDCLGTLRQLAGQAALALGNVALMQELEAASFGALTALARAIDAASPWTAGHSERVTAGALEIGRRLGLSPEELDQLHRGGLLHDVGKLGVPAAILDKPGRLTEEELAVARSHAVLGASILSPIPAFRDVLPIVRNHHELLDGSGYPDRLAGDRIPRLVRIVTAADVFDALVSDRPYRSSWSTEQALAHLQEHASVWFDREAVDALAAAVAEGWSAGHHPVARPRGPGVGGEPRRQAGRRAVPLPAGPEVG